uniref:Putative glycosyl transferase n=1 Tax=viral metagenome TaxID=1070528 RepID=A0A6M3JMP3_9ZZZZ
MKLIVGVPNYDGVKTEMMMSLIPNLFLAYNKYDHKLAYELVCPAGCHNYKNRNKIVMDSLESKSDYVFMVDTDMEFPDDTLVKLLEDDKDIVGCTYNKRALPLTPIHAGERPKELYRINAVPTGVILIKSSVLRVMDPPWFAVQWLSGVEFMGPDIYFCTKATRDYGFEVWLDPTIEVKHLGEYKY